MRRMGGKKHNGWGRSRRFSGFGPGRNWHERRQAMQRVPLYRSRSGILLGVCRGLADYFDMSVFMVRAVVVVSFIITGIWPVGILYLVAAVLMKPEPVIPFSNDDEREFYDSYADSRSNALARVKRKFDNLDRRIRRMEDVVTSKDFEWEQKLKG
mgnify:CR=1 FL=1